MNDVFLEHRRLLFSTAYQLLGSVADAEDVVQDAWLKWSAVDHDAVERPKAYLVRTVTNLSLNRLTSARAVRETYVGPWLPEPLLTAADAAEEAEMADTVSTAMLVVLETLGPVERAVFVLREVFGYSHAEIGAIVERPEATVRQIARRSRNHVQSRRPRYDADDATRRDVTDRFLSAARGGDVNALMEVLAEGVTLWNDGGGKVAGGATAGARSRPRRPLAARCDGQALLGRCPPRAGADQRGAGPAGPPRRDADRRTDLRRRRRTARGDLLPGQPGQAGRPAATAGVIAGHPVSRRR